MANENRSSRIAALNDALRQNGRGGRIFMTKTVQEFGQEFVHRAIAQVREFDRFTEDNDPYGEHDFGCVEVDGEKLFWKIDYYDHTLQQASPNPADPAETIRVLTLMHASDY